MFGNVALGLQMTIKILEVSGITQWALKNDLIRLDLNTRLKMHVQLLVGVSLFTATIALYISQS